MNDAAVETLLREAAAYRELLTVVLEQLHAAYERERWRKESRGRVDTNRRSDRAGC